jgi:hypothetical protein
MYSRLSSLLRSYQRVTGGDLSRLDNLLYKGFTYAKEKS